MNRRMRTADVGLVLHKIVDRVRNKELARLMGQKVLDYSKTKKDIDDLTPDEVRLLYRRDHYGERERLTKKVDLDLGWTDHAEYHGDLRDMDPRVVNDAIADVLRKKMMPMKGKKPRLKSNGPVRLKAPGVGTMVVDYDLTKRPAEADVVTVWASRKAAKKYGHTLWIDPKGKVIDMGNGDMHYNWIAKNWDKLFPDVEMTDKGVYDLPEERGWLRVRNHIFGFGVPALAITGQKRYIKKSGDLLMDLVIQGLEQAREKGKELFVDIYDGNKRTSYVIPEDLDDLMRVM